MLDTQFVCQSQSFQVSQTIFIVVQQFYCQSHNFHDSTSVRTKVFMQSERQCSSCIFTKIFLRISKMKFYTLDLQSDPVELVKMVRIRAAQVFLCFCYIASNQLLIMFCRVWGGWGVVTLTTPKDIITTTFSTLMSLLYVQGLMLNQDLTTEIS